MPSLISHSFDLIYYRNRKGTLAVALEETPERLYLPNGAQVQHTAAWAEEDVETHPVTQQQLAQVQQQHAPIAARDTARSQQVQQRAAAAAHKRGLESLRCWARWVSYRGEDRAAQEIPQGAAFAQQHPQLAQQYVQQARAKQARDDRSFAQFNRWFQASVFGR